MSSAKQQTSLLTFFKPTATVGALKRKAEGAVTEASLSTSAERLKETKISKTENNGPLGGSREVAIVPKASLSLVPSPWAVPLLEKPAGYDQWTSTMGPRWREILAAELQKQYMFRLFFEIQKERSKGVQVYPPDELMFNSFHLTDFDNVEVVIIGQDPYVQPGQAMGLAFSVPKGKAPPPSLKNIFKELESDSEAHFQRPSPLHGDLSGWASQGVFLLNSILSVRRGAPLSHQGLGWEQFTDAVIKALNEKQRGVIFLLWGRPAQLKAKGVSHTRHHILTAAHPSPNSAEKGFFGCKHFSKVNAWLTAEGKSTIDWNLTDI